MSNAQHMRTLLTKRILETDILHNTFNLDTLELMKKACTTLNGVLRLEKLVLTQVVVKNILMNDMVQLGCNLDNIICAIKLKEMNIKPICLN